MKSNQNVKYLIGKLMEVPKLIDEIFFMFEDVSEINGKLERIVKEESLNKQGDSFFSAHGSFKIATYNLIEKINNLYPGYVEKDLDYNPKYLKLNPIHSEYVIDRASKAYDISCKIYFIFDNISKINQTLHEIVHYDSLNKNGHDFDSVHTLFEEVIENISGKIFKLSPLMKMRQSEIMEQWEEIKEENMNFNSGICTLKKGDLITAMEGTVI